MDRVVDVTVLGWAQLYTQVDTEHVHESASTKAIGTCSSKAGGVCEVSYN